MAWMRELEPGTAIAATCSGRTPLCASVYFQDTFSGIREFFHASGHWSGGHSYKILFHSKHHSPIAVAEWNDVQRNIRIFTLDKENNIIESCHNGSNWFGGTLIKSPAFKAAPFSKLSAIAWDRNLSLYYQTADDWHDKHEIRELCYSPDGWTEGPTLPAFIKPKPLKGTTIASICWGNVHIRTYFQGEDFKILQASRERVWSLSSLLLPAKPYSPLAAVTWFGDDKRHIRLYSIDDDDRLQEYGNDGGDWFLGPLSHSNIQAAPYSNLSAIYYDSRVRLYYQPANDDSVKECCLDFGGDWFEGETLRANPSDWKAVDINGATYPVGWLPYILDLNSWQTYDPALIDGVGMIVGYFDGKIVGEELQSKQSTILAPNTNGNSYTWIYAPGGAILYRYCEHDHSAGYDRQSWQFGTGQPVICGGEFRIAQGNYLESVVVIVCDNSGQLKQKASQCLGPVATKLQTLGLSLTEVNWSCQRD